MVYKVIGLMSGSSLDGLDIAYVHLQQQARSQSAGAQGLQGAQGGQAANAAQGWEFQLVQTVCYPYSDEWQDRLAGAAALTAFDYQLLHTEYGNYLGREVARFIAEHGLEYQVQLIASHGHTVFHYPERRMTAQVGDGAAIAAETGINVVSDLRAMDVALGGQGAPIVPVGEGMLWGDYDLFLNLGGIANVSKRGGAEFAGGSGAGAAGAGGAVAGGWVAFDVAPANRVLNALAGEVGLLFDRDGLLAAQGRVDAELLTRLDALPYYGMGYPKSLANEFGLEVVLPFVNGAGLSLEDGLRTYVAHLVGQVGRAVESLGFAGGAGAPARMLVTGGGAHNVYMVGQLRERLAGIGVEVVIPEPGIVDFKEALVMALIGVLRWREEANVLASVTGASRDSIGGAVWMA